MLVLALAASGLIPIGLHLIAYLEDKGYSPQKAAYVMGFQGFIKNIWDLVGWNAGRSHWPGKTL